MVEPMSRGDPMSPLCWTCKSTAHLAEELTRQDPHRRVDASKFAEGGGQRPLDPWYVAIMLLAHRITLDFHCTCP